LSYVIDEYEEVALSFGLQLIVIAHGIAMIIGKTALRN
jgi:hypothetical protein